jgi:HSP20 family molecular chaperone IbpA
VNLVSRWPDATPRVRPRISLAIEERKMSRLSLFNSPLLLGFEHFERALDRVNKISGDGYPPYNVEQLGDNELRITLAVAGFTMGDLSITIEDNQLVIRGKQADDGQRIYLHRGIAARQFQRSFVLAEGIEVRGAWLENGLLHLDLVRPTVEARVRTVPIRAPDADAPASVNASANAAGRITPARPHLAEKSAK